MNNKEMLDDFISRIILAEDEGKKLARNVSSI